jgi:acyl carrier protein
MSVLKRLFDRLRTEAAPDGKSEAEPSPSSMSAAAVAPSGARDAIVRALAAQLVKQSENGLTYESIDPNAGMCDRGYLDSLSYVAFVVFVEETYGVRISDYQLTNSLRTVSAVADWVLVESKSLS